MRPVAVFVGASLLRLRSWFVLTFVVLGAACATSTPYEWLGHGGTLVAATAEGARQAALRAGEPCVTSATEGAAHDCMATWESKWGAAAPAWRQAGARAQAFADVGPSLRARIARRFAPATDGGVP